MQIDAVRLRLLRRLRQSEIQQHKSSLGRDERVARRQVAVRDPGFVQPSRRAAERTQQARPIVRSSDEVRAEARSLDALEDQVVAIDFVHDGCTKAGIAGRGEQSGLVTGALAAKSCVE